MNDTGHVVPPPTWDGPLACRSERLLHCDRVLEVRSDHVRLASQPVSWCAGTFRSFRCHCPASKLKCQRLCKVGKRNYKVSNAAAEVRGSLSCALSHIAELFGMFAPQGKKVQVSDGSGKEVRAHLSWSHTTWELVVGDSDKLLVVLLL